MNKEMQLELSKGLQRFNPIDAAIDRLRVDYTSLTIHGVEDTEGLKVVHNARMEVRAKRLEVENIRKELVADANAWTTAVNGEARRIKGLLEPIENDLKAKEDFINEEKERLRQAEAIRKQKLANDRMARLSQAGMTYTGGGYSLGSKDADNPKSLYIDRSELETISEEGFEEVLIEALQIAALNEDYDRRKEEENRIIMERSTLLYRYGYMQRGDDLVKGAHVISHDRLLQMEFQQWAILTEELERERLHAEEEQRKKDLELEALRKLKQELEAREEHPHPTPPEAPAAPPPDTRKTAAKPNPAPYSTTMESQQRNGSHDILVELMHFQSALTRLRVPEVIMVENNIQPLFEHLCDEIERVIMTIDFSD